jgi:SAM-dependent methyltransferase
MEILELRERVEAFPRWHYQFDLGNGVTTPIWKPDRINRHEQRRRYFFDALLRVTGASLRGHRVLDLGCNAGFWSLNAIEAGADFVLGVDGRQMHIDQANLVFEAKAIDPARYRFELGNIFDHEFTERFDVVLCLGLMYHISKPVELFELIAGTGAELVVIDTRISRAEGSFFEVMREGSLDDPRNAVDYELILVPTRQAVVDLAAQFSFQTVPLRLNMTDFSGAAAYRDHGRLAFLCSRSAPLDMLAEEPQPPRWSLRVRAVSRARGKLARLVKRMRRGRQRG